MFSLSVVYPDTNNFITLRAATPKRITVRGSALVGLLSVAALLLAPAAGASPQVRHGGQTAPVKSGFVVTPVSFTASSLDAWIDQAVATLKAAGYSASQMNPADIKMIIMHESSGNPNAANYSDSNAARGTPSKGLMQVIDPTFQSYSLAGHADIWKIDVTTGALTQVTRSRSLRLMQQVLGRG